MSHDAFSHYDAAFVMGALSPADRQAFEAHLDRCDGCRQAVAEVAGLPGLLSRVDPAVLEQGSDALPTPDAERIPDSLLPSLLAEVSRSRRRRRARVMALAAAAAVAAVVTGVALGAGESWLPGEGSSPAVVQSSGRAMTQVDQTRLSARVAMEEVAWGTRLRITCTYEAQPYGDAGLPAYALVVHTREGAEQVATWRAVSGKPATVVAATASRPSEITSVEVRTTGGEPVLRLRG